MKPTKTRSNRCTVNVFAICYRLILFGPLFACFDLTAAATSAEFPADSTINQDAGRGNFIFLTIHLADQEALPFLLDTGSPITVFDKTLEPKLGKRLKTGTMRMGPTEQKCGVYSSPELYLGNTTLLTGSNVLTYDLTKAERHATWVKHHSMYSGILGMDCLKHYCVQLDFEAERVRFLDFNHLDAAKLGHAFPLKFQGGHIYLEHAGLLGGSNTNSLIDSGWYIDGRVEGIDLKSSRTGNLPSIVWNGDTYTNLNVQSAQNANMLGLRFLARHLVTFDFPDMTIYLKQTSVGPLPPNKS